MTSRLPIRSGAFKTRPSGPASQAPALPSPAASRSGSIPAGEPKTDNAPGASVYEQAPTRPRAADAAARWAARLQQEENRDLYSESSNFALWGDPIDPSAAFDISGSSDE